MRALILVFFILLTSISALSKIDDSVDIFFPPNLKYLQRAQTQFSVFWWNFVVVEPAAGQADWEKVQRVCLALKPQLGRELKRLACGDDLTSFMKGLEQWADDFIFRQVSPPSSVIQETFQGTLSEMGLLSSVQKDLFQLRRRDPFEQWQVYLSRNESLTSFQFKREKGVLFDPTTQRLVIPLQFERPPQMKNAQQVMERLSREAGVSLVGSHGASYTNEKQVHQDMEIVSVVGVLVLIIFIGFLVLKGRISALLLFPPVALAMAISASLVEWMYGSIHGLTLAFGSGIIGLAVDYGLHGAFNAESKQTWKSNAVGFLTTLTGLAVMIMSGIPLIRQMMAFAVLGLFFGFLFFYLLCRYAPRYFTMKSIDLPLWKFRFNSLPVVLLILVGFASFFKANLSFDLRKFNYQTALEKEASDWFFTHNGDLENFLVLHKKEELFPSVLDEKKWSSSEKIIYVGLGDFIEADPAQQKLWQESWQASARELEKKSSSLEKRVFKPFLDNLKLSRPPLDFSNLASRDYLNHLVGQDHFLSLFTARSSEESRKVREKFPESQSISESVQGFSRSLEKDLRWMIPAAFLLSTLILFIYYRSVTCVLTAYIPFFTGLGLFYLVHFFQHRADPSLNLISILGLLMVFGFSLDYGVFSTDIYKFPQHGEDEKKVYSALGLAAISNIIGFFPLVFAKHPVLHQLGAALFYGTIGTYFGTIWGVENLYHWKKWNWKKWLQKKS